MNRLMLARILFLSAALWAAPGGAGALSAAESTPLPAIVELQVFPPRLELGGIRDSRRLLVSGRTADGQSIDLTTQAKLSAEGDAIAVERDGYVTPRKAGAARFHDTSGD